MVLGLAAKKLLAEPLLLQLSEVYASSGLGVLKVNHGITRD